MPANCRWDLIRRLKGWYICFSCVGVDNELYNMHGTWLLVSAPCSFRFTVSVLLYFQIQRILLTASWNSSLAWYGPWSFITPYLCPCGKEKTSLCMEKEKVRHPSRGEWFCMRDPYIVQSPSFMCQLSFVTSHRISAASVVGQLDGLR